jgi:hypothetical protein
MIEVAKDWQEIAKPPHATLIQWRQRSSSVQPGSPDNLSIDFWPVVDSFQQISALFAPEVWTSLLAEITAPYAFESMLSDAANCLNGLRGIAHS